MISVVPSGPIRVSTSFFWSLGSQWLSIRIFVNFFCFRNSETVRNIKDVDKPLTKKCENFPEENHIFQHLSYHANTLNN